MIIPQDVPQQLCAKKRSTFRSSTTASTSRASLRICASRRCFRGCRKSIVAGRLKRDQKTESYTDPIQVKAEDVATASEVGGNTWSRLFPFLLVMMSLTGAFYPAIDLCAGEKERGTMETLLISPASRAELVLGKFLTVMLASVMTALLNLVSMGLTGFSSRGSSAR